MTDTEQHKPSGKYRITQDRWCWCGRAAALIIERRRDGEIVENVCTEEHGQRSIFWLENGQTTVT